MKKTKQKNLKLPAELLEEFEEDCDNRLLNQTSVFTALMIYWLKSEDGRGEVLSQYAAHRFEYDT